MHWYALSKKTGMATLCLNEEDARREAESADRFYPNAAPHIATRLVPVDAGSAAKLPARDAFRATDQDDDNDQNGHWVPAGDYVHSGERD